MCRAIEKWINARAISTITEACQRDSFLGEVQRRSPDSLSTNRHYSDVIGLTASATPHEARLPRYAAHQREPAFHLA